MTNDQYNIFDVVKDVIAGDVELADDNTKNARRSVCDSCEARNSIIDVCTACGCFIPLKIKLIKSTCPMEKW